MASRLAPVAVFVLAGLSRTPGPPFTAEALSDGRRTGANYKMRIVVCNRIRGAEGRRKQEQAGASRCR